MTWRRILRRFRSGLVHHTYFATAQLLDDAVVRDSVADHQIGVLLGAQHVTTSVMGLQGMRTWRVMCPLLSQKVTLLARNGSSGAGCTLPSASNALDVTMCWPVAGIPQPNVQNLHAKPRLFRL